MNQLRFFLSHMSYDQIMNYKKCMQMTMDRNKHEIPDRMQTAYLVNIVRIDRAISDAFMMYYIPKVINQSKWLSELARVNYKKAKKYAKPKVKKLYASYLKAKSYV